MCLIHNLGVINAFKEVGNDKKMVFGKLRQAISENEGKCLISFYGGFGIFFGASLSDFYGTNIPPLPDSTSRALGIPANLAFGAITFVILMMTGSLKQRPHVKLETRAIYTFVLMMLISAVYMILARNPGVTPWLGSHSVLVTIVTGLYVLDPVGSEIAKEVDKKQSREKLDLIVALLKMRRGDYVKSIDLAILGTLALFTITMAWLNTQLPEFKTMGVSSTAGLVYAAWFSYNFIGLMVGVICQLFQKLGEIDKAFSTMIRNAR